MHLHLVARFERQLAQPLPHRLQRPPGSQQVAPGHHLTSGIHQHQVGADRANIDPQVHREPTGKRAGATARGSGVSGDNPAQGRHGASRGRRLQHRLETLQVGQTRCQATFGIIAGDQRCAHRRHHLVAFGYDQLAGRQLQHPLEGPHHGPVVGHPALEENGRRKTLAPRHHTLEIARQRQAETGQNVGQRATLLLQVDHIGLCEHRAAPGDAGRVARLQSQPRKLVLDCDTQALGLLVEERAGPGGTERVHCKINQAHLARRCVPVEHEELTILPADLDHRARLGMHRAHRAGLRDQLVDMATTDQPGNRLAARTGQAHPGNGRRVTHGSQIAQAGNQGSAGLAIRAAVAMGNERAGLIKQNDFNRRRANIDPDETCTHTRSFNDPAATGILSHRRVPRGVRSRPRELFRHRRVIPTRQTGAEAHPGSSPFHRRWDLASW